jgi:hypothetical protein
MKNLISFSFLFLFALIIQAQVTITQADFPTVGDTVRFSVSYDMQQIGDPDLTGTNYTWDYSSIIPDTQVFVSYIDPASLPTAYGDVFNNVSNPELQASWALPYDLPIPPLPGITLDNELLFAKIDATGLYRPGLGARINSTHTAVPFDSIQTMYEFPLNYGDTIRSNTTFNLVLPSIGTIKEYRYRTSAVHGWGTIITPYGSFQAIKVKSVINVMDTINDGTNLYAIPRTETEFVWLSPNNGDEIMQIYSSNSTTILYKDIPRSQGIENNTLFQNLSLFPNPCTDNFTVYLNSTSHLEQLQLNILDISGRLVQTDNISFDQNSFRKTIDVSNLQSGVYFVQVQSGKEKITKKLIIQ